MDSVVIEEVSIGQRACVGISALYVSSIQMSLVLFPVGAGHDTAQKGWAGRQRAGQRLGSAWAPRALRSPYQSLSRLSLVSNSLCDRGRAGLRSGLWPGLDPGQGCDLRHACKGILGRHSHYNITNNGHHLSGTASLGNQRSKSPARHAFHPNIRLSRQQALASNAYLTSVNVGKGVG